MEIINWTKIALAEGIGVSPQYINKVGKGERKLSLDKKKKLKIFYEKKRDILTEKIIELEDELSGKF